MTKLHLIQHDPIRHWHEVLVFEGQADEINRLYKTMQDLRPNATIMLITEDQQHVYFDKHTNHWYPVGPDVLPRPIQQHPTNLDQGGSDER